MTSIFENTRRIRLLPGASPVGGFAGDLVRDDDAGTRALSEFDGMVR